MSCISATLVAMRASRLLSILMLLQTRGRLSAPALAEALEVSQRTILRDIDHLSAAGVPVWSDRGRHGGFQLREGWSTQLTGLTEPEARALFLAGLPGPAAELGLGSAAASARLKMLATLPAEWRGDAQRVAARLHVDHADWFQPASRAEHLGAVADAVWQQWGLSMRYESWSGVSQREVEPLGLVLKAGVWYMAARARAGAEARIFRLSNIHALTVRPTHFEHPADFDLPTFWRSATQRFETEIYRGTAVLRVSQRGMRLLLQLSPAVAQAVRTAVADPVRANWRRVTIPIESIEHASNQLLRLGAEAEVLAPAALRRRMAASARRLARLYDPG
jgi:predicted DNA-binding transcriptional regulator YafY